MSIGTMVIELCVFNNKEKYIEHGQSVKIHFSITLDTSGLFVKYLVYTFVSTCFIMQKRTYMYTCYSYGTGSYKAGTLQCEEMHMLKHVINSRHK